MSQTKILYFYIITLFLFGISLKVHGNVEDNSSYLPWIAWQNNVDNIKSGEGNLTWTKHNTKINSESIVHYNFGFEGIKKRWIKSFKKNIINGQPHEADDCLEADNGIRSYDSFKGDNYVYARQTGRHNSGRWNGSMLDYKYFINPLKKPYNEIKALVDSSNFNLVTSKNSNGQFESKISNGPSTIIITFEPKLGYAPIIEKLYHNNSLLSETYKTYVKSEEGIFYWTSIIQKKYDEGKKKPFYESEIKVHDFSPNKKLASNYFLPSGFAEYKEQEIRVVDRVAGDLTYLVNKSEESMHEELNEMVNDIHFALNKQDSSIVSSADKNPTLFAGGKEHNPEEQTINDLVFGEEDISSKPHYSHSYKWAYLFITIPILVFLLKARHPKKQ